MRLLAFFLIICTTQIKLANAQQSFADAIRAMEEIVFRQPGQVGLSDVAIMDRVLQFVSANLPEPAFGLPAPAPSSPTGHWECRCSTYRGWCGRVYHRNFWVFVPSRPKPARSNSSALARKIEELQNAIANVGRDRGINLRDLALQVYGATLSADSDSQAGRIIR